LFLLHSVSIKSSLFFLFFSFVNQQALARKEQRGYNTASRGGPVQSFTVDDDDDNDGRRRGSTIGSMPRPRAKTAGTTDEGKDGNNKAPSTSSGKFSSPASTRVGISHTSPSANISLNTAPPSPDPLTSSPSTTYQSLLGTPQTSPPSRTGAATTAATAATTATNGKVHFAVPLSVAEEAEYVRLPSHLLSVVGLLIGMNHIYDQ
jgi:hypothetical protein